MALGLVPLAHINSFKSTIFITTKRRYFFIKVPMWDTKIQPTKKACVNLVRDRKWIFEEGNGVAGD